jgi:lipopolysaccharide transport system permease protein
VIPLAAVLSGLVDLAVATPLLVIMMAVYGIWPGAAAAALPLVLLLALVTATGFGLWFAALNVEYRDVRYVLPFIIQIWLFVSPVIYPASQVAPLLAKHGVPPWTLALNPMAGVVEGFRWAALGHGQPPTMLLVVSTAVAVTLWVTGALYFRSVERSFADVV